MRLLESSNGNQSTNQQSEKEKKPMPNQEIQELLTKIDEYKQLIEDAENALDAAIENLEEALEEANEE